MPNSSDVNSVASATSAKTSAHHGGEPATSVCGGTLRPRPIGSGPMSRLWPAVCADSRNKSATTAAAAIVSQ